MEFIVCFIFFVIFSVGVFIFHRCSRVRRLRLPPGRLGLPLIGESLQLITAYKSDNPEPFVDERVKRFGPLFLTHVFGEATVFSVDSDFNRFILQNEGKLFESSYPSSIATLLGKHSLSLMKGARHKKMHSFTLSFANSSILRNYLFHHIDRLVRLNLDSWPELVYLLDETKKITFELTMKQLLSFDPSEWTERLRKEYVLVIEGFFSVPIFSGTYRKAIKARGKVAEALGVVVRQRRREFEADEKKNDMLGALLEAEDCFSDEEIVDFLVSLLVAGYETTSTIMALAVKFLTDTPLALDQLKVEHAQIQAQKASLGSLEWDDYKSMPFTRCVVNETLRVGNIIGGVFRRATTDILVGDYVIPKGWKVFASFRGVHMSHDNFEDARSFNPWRWQDMPGVTSIGSGTAFTPFGGGTRLCPGYELARVAISVFLHHLVTQFSWTTAEDDKLVFFPTTRTQKRYPIIVQRLQKLPVE